jgi:Mrp family chromosome partitioning ATPase
VSLAATVVDASSTHPLDTTAHCPLVTGPPGAGKSTVSRMVAAVLKRSALLDGDWVSRLVVSGRVWALGWWFDTSALAAEPTVERVLAEAAARPRSSHASVNIHA